MKLEEYIEIRKDAENEYVKNLGEINNIKARVKKLSKLTLDYQATVFSLTFFGTYILILCLLTCCFSYILSPIILCSLIMIPAFILGEITSKIVAYKNKSKEDMKDVSETQIEEFITVLKARKNELCVHNNILFQKRRYAQNKISKIKDHNMNLICADEYLMSSKRYQNLIDEQMDIIKKKSLQKALLQRNNVYHRPGSQIAKIIVLSLLTSMGLCVLPTIVFGLGLTMLPLGIMSIPTTSLIAKYPIKKHLIKQQILKKYSNKHHQEESISEINQHLDKAVFYTTDLIIKSLHKSNNTSYEEKTNDLYMANEEIKPTKYQPNSLKKIKKIIY